MTVNCTVSNTWFEYLWISVTMFQLYKFYLVFLNSERIKLLFVNLLHLLGRRAAWVSLDMARPTGGTDPHSVGSSVGSVRTGQWLVRSSHGVVRPVRTDP